jgi:hypothetical protein
LATIKVTPATPSIAMNATQQFAATAEDSSGNIMSGLTFTWASSATSVATIDGSSGMATGKAVGTTQITASSGGVTSSGITLTVTAPAVATIVVAPASPSIAVSGTQQFTATAKDSGGNAISGVTFTWTSSATNVATIDSGSGLATGVAVGTTQITATAGGVTSSGDTLTVTPPPTSVSGTAAIGSPIANAVVTLKDSAGHSSTATTGADGTYTLTTTGFTPPFLVQVQTSSGNLYSVSADALVTTTINTDPFTDLIIRSWYNSQAQAIDTVFDSPGTTTPAPSSVLILANAVMGVPQMWLTNNGVDISKFNLISTPFPANGSGVDKVLDETTVNTSKGTVTITDGVTTQTSTITYDTTATSMTIATTTTNANGTSTSSSTTVLPGANAQQTALANIGATLAGLVNAVNTNGSQLTADEITPYLASDLLNDGLDQSQYAALLATALRGKTLSSAQIEAVNSLDVTNGTADILTGSSIPALGELWFEDVSGMWLIAGDKRIAQVSFAVANRVHQGFPASQGGSGGSGVSVGLNVSIPGSTLSSATVTDSSGMSGWNATPLAFHVTNVQTLAPTATTTLQINSSEYDPSTGGWADLGSNVLPVGTLFTVNLTPASGSPVSYTWLSNAFTTESISILSPTSGSLSDYTLGQAMTVTWQLPTTFAIAGVGLQAEVYTALPMSNGGYQCDVSGSTTPPATGFPTSGTITLPTTCNGQPVVFVELEVGVWGIHGESEGPTVNID